MSWRGLILLVLLLPLSANAIEGSEKETHCEVPLQNLGKSILDLGRSKPGHGWGNQTAQRQEKESPAEAEGKSSMGGDEKPPRPKRRLPKPKSGHEVSNIELDTQDETPVLFLESEAKALHWKILHYRQIDPFQNSWNNPSPLTLTPLVRTTEKPDAHLLIRDLEETDEGHLLVPSGYRPMFIEPELGTVSVDAIGNFHLKPQATTLSIPLKRQENRALTPEEEQIYTSVQTIDDSAWPPWVRELLVQMDQKRASGATEPEIAQLVSETLYSHPEYTKKGSHAGSVLDQARCASFQCTGGTSIATVLLRSRKVPTRPVTGYPAQQGEKEGIALYLPTIGHAWVEVFDRMNSKWIPFEVTPHQKNEEEHSKGGESGGGRGPVRDASQDEKILKKWEQFLGHLIEGNEKNPPDFKEMAKFFEKNASSLSAPKLANVYSAFEALHGQHKKNAHLSSLAKMQQSLKRSLSQGGDYLQLRDTAHFFETAFEQLSLLRPLLPQESDFYTGLVKTGNLLAEALAQEVSQKEQGRALYSKLPGPYSRAHAKDQAGVDARGEIDGEKLAKLAATQQWRPVVQMVQAAQLSGVQLLNTEVPSKGHSLDGVYAPERTEGVIRSRAAESLDDLPLVNTDGIPFNQVVHRLLEGELHYNVFRQPKRDDGGAKLAVKTRTAVLEDYSGSMADDKKYIFRELVSAGLIDSHSRSLHDPRGEGLVWLMPFTNAVEEPVLVKEPFVTMKQKWHSPGGAGGGNLIGKALNQAVKLIHSEKSDIFNVVLLTDGLEDTFDPSAFLGQIKDVFPKTRVNFNAVLVGGSNSELKKAVEELNALLGSRGKGEYHEVSIPQIQSILSRENAPSALVNLAAEEKARQVLPPYSSLLQRLKSHLDRTLAAAAQRAGE